MNTGAFMGVPPAVIVQVGGTVIGVPETVHVPGATLSLGANPLPVTVTDVPTGPEVRLRAIDG